MKTKSKKRENNFTHYSPFDLFGEIPVTQDEVILWCEVIANIPPSSWRLETYIKFWDVPAKIRAAKARMPLQVYIDLAKSLS